MDLGYHSLGPNYGFWVDRITPEVNQELKQQIDDLQSDFSKGKKLNDELAGEIQHEYKIQIQPTTLNYIKNLVSKIDIESSYITKIYSPKYKLQNLPDLAISNLWINFQKKYEYNPIHKHDGIYSFVIWYQIPYTFEDELKYHYSKSPCEHGEFQFVVPTIFSNDNVTTYKLGIDKNAEGCVAIFPSSLCHLVYPFYSSDEYRITVAGNVVNLDEGDYSEWD